MADDAPAPDLHSRIPPRRPSWSWGLLLPHWGHTRCYRCRRPWWAAEPRSVQYKPGRGQFALCTWCWATLDTWWRFHAHHWVIHTWAQTATAWTSTEAETVYEAIESLDPVMTPRSTSGRE